MPRRSRARARTAIGDEPNTEFGENKIDAEIRKERAIKKESEGGNTVVLNKTKKNEEPRTKELSPLEKANGSKKEKPKEPKVRVGLLTDINRALLKNRDKPTQQVKQTGGRISILT